MKQITGIQEMTIQDYEACIALWKRTPGIGLSGADAKDAIEQFLMRNHGLSFLYLVKSKLVGTIYLCIRS